MKEFLVIPLALILHYHLFGQETKLIIKKSADEKKPKGEIGKRQIPSEPGPYMDFVEEYNVLKSDESIRHGTYIKYRHSFFGIQVLESGSYQNGQQNGLWEYYHDRLINFTGNSIKERGVYVNGKKNGVWTSYYIDKVHEKVAQEKFGSQKIDSISISIDHQEARVKLVGMYLNDKRVGEWTSFTYSREIYQTYNFSRKMLVRDSSLEDTVNYNVNRRALFIGGLPCLMEFLVYEFNISDGAISEIWRDSTSIIVSFTIDKDGNLLDPKIQKSQGNRRLENEVLRVVALTDKRWIPGMKESTNVNSTYKILSYVIRKGISYTSRSYTVRFKPIFD